jgi:hypothetical protein
LLLNYATIKSQGTCLNVRAAVLNARVKVFRPLWEFYPVSPVVSLHLAGFGGGIFLCAKAFGRPRTTTMQEKIMSKPRFAALVTLILAATASRLIPHPPDFTPITAIALFGGAYFSKKWLSFLVLLASLVLSDLVLGHFAGPYVYGSFVLIVCIGFLLHRRRKPLAIGFAALASSILFFVLANFGVWLSGLLYPRTMGGLAACYIAAIPFFRNMVVGDAFYTAVLFGGFALAEQFWPALAEPATAR